MLQKYRKLIDMFGIAMTVLIMIALAVAYYMGKPGALGQLAIAALLLSTEVRLYSATHHK